MFTGIVEERGVVTAIEDRGDALQVHVAAPGIMSGVRPGDSIAVAGVCLTVVEADDRGFVADVMRETLDRSTLGGRGPGEAVNVERALPVDGRLGGHVVQGHVDGIVKLLSRKASDHWETLRFALPERLARYVVEKGSVALDGTSLTVSACGADWFEVSLVPVTLASTTHGDLRPGDRVNIEADVLAKYVERMTGGAPGEGARRD